MAKRNDNLDWFDIDEASLPRTLETARKKSAAAYQAYKAEREAYHAMLAKAFSLQNKVPEGKELLIARTGFGKLRGAFTEPRAVATKAGKNVLSLDK